MTDLRSGDTTPPPGQFGPGIFHSEGTVDGVLLVHFTEAVLPGTGAIALLDRLGTVVGSWDMSNPAVTVSGTDVAIDPGHVLMPGAYTIRTDGPVVTGTSGIAFPHPRDTSPVQLGTTADGGHVVRPFYGAADGAGSNDTAVLDGRIEDYTIVRHGDDLLATHARGNFAYTGAERVMFTQSEDVMVASQGGVAAQIYRLYEAAFDRAPDRQGLGYWLYQQQEGMDLRTMATKFIVSAEFLSRYGATLNDTAFVSSLYHNVLHRDGDAGGIVYHVGNLSKGMERAEVLLAFSESPENQTAVAQLIGNGYFYTPYA